jgi:hypothetical protein
VSFKEENLKRLPTRTEDVTESKKSLRKSSTRQAGSSNENSIKEASSPRENSGVVSDNGVIKLKEIEEGDHNDGSVSSNSIIITQK